MYAKKKASRFDLKIFLTVLSAAFLRAEIITFK